MTSDIDIPDSPLERALLLQNTLVSRATGGSFDEAIYSQLRSEFMGNTSTRALLPRYVRTCRDGEQLWGHFRGVSYGTGSYQVRRDYIYGTFQPLLEHLEGTQATPSDPGITETLSSFDPDGVHRAWERALERRQQDPEGAITAARTLLETVCKRILDEAGETYRDSADLPELYSRTAAILDLAPSQHTERVFRAILGGCHTVVQNLGTLRNRIGDAHGQGGRPVRPGPRHAALAVNLAGSMATFLVETWLARQEA